VLILYSKLTTNLALLAVLIRLNDDSSVAYFMGHFVYCDACITLRRRIIMQQNVSKLTLYSC